MLCLSDSKVQVIFPKYCMFVYFLTQKISVHTRQHNTQFGAQWISRLCLQPSVWQLSKAPLKIFFPVSVFFIIILRYFPWCLACCRWEREKLYVWVINSPSACFPAKDCTNQSSSVCCSAVPLVSRITAEFNRPDTNWNWNGGWNSGKVKRMQWFQEKKIKSEKLLKLRAESYIIHL